MVPFVPCTARHHVRVILHQRPNTWLLFFCTWPVAALLHLIWTRGIYGVGHWLMHVVGLSVVMAVFLYPTFLLLDAMDMIDLNDFVPPAGFSRPLG